MTGWRLRRLQDFRGTPPEGDCLPGRSGLHSACAGFTYVEVLVAALLLAIAIAPALEALQTGLLSSRVHQDATEEHYHLLGKPEEVLAEPFSALDAAALAAGGPSIATSPHSSRGG